MKREIIQLFLDWKIRKTRKPLVVRGARQVGKTYAINEFAHEHFSSFLSINLEESPELRSLFSSNSPQNILQELSIIKKVEVIPGQTLLFIDEIQTCPEAIVYLRYFYEQIPELHVIAAGSLLDHALNEIKQSMPVGRVEFCYMHPLSFREFLWAMNETRLSDYLDNFTLDQSLSEALHKRLLDLMRYYIFIGGMPESVKVYTESKQLIEVQRVHSNIITSFQYDFAKYGNKNQQRHLINVLNYVAHNPGKKIKYVNIDKDSRSTYLKEAFYKLESSRIIHLVTHTSSSGIPLTTHLNNEIFKAFFLDIGLVNYLSRIQLIDPPNLLTTNEGAIAEQFVCQELLTLEKPFIDPKLSYWAREEKNANAEVDFLLQVKNNIYPVEVKAGKTGTLKSMHVYLSEKKLNTGIRLNTDLPSSGDFRIRLRLGTSSRELNYKLISLPLYMVNQLTRLLNS